MRLDALDRGRRDQQDLPVPPRRRALHRQADRIAFGARRRRIAVHLVEQHIPDRPHRQARRAVRAGDRDAPALESLMQDAVVGIARADVRDLAVQARRIAKHRRQPVFAPRLTVLYAGLHHEHRPRIAVDDVADEGVQALGLADLARRHEHDALVRAVRGERVEERPLVRRPIRPPVAGLGRCFR